MRLYRVPYVLCPDCGTLLEIVRPHDFPEGYWCITHPDYTTREAACKFRGKIWQVRKSEMGIVEAEDYHGGDSGKVL